MDRLIAKLKGLFNQTQKPVVKTTPLSQAELKQEAEKFAETYGDVLKKLAEE